MAEATKTEQTTLEALVRGAEKTFANAEQLFREAQLLGEAGAVARALCLHQISLEECSKLDMLGAWAVTRLLGFEVNQKQMLAALARHAAKNKTNAYMLALSRDEEEAQAAGDFDAAREAFKQIQVRFHANSNAAKNAALYVDWVEGAFVAPAERITAAMLAEIIDRNAEFLGFAHNHLKTLQRLEANPDIIRELLSDFVEKAEKLRTERPDNLMAELDALLADFFEEGKAKLQD
jgi:AbiV family abortive infection protein